MSLPRYPEYKDSGVAWLGEVPGHWEVLPCRAFVDEQTAKNDDGTNENYLSLMANVGIIPYAEKGDVGNKKPEDLTKCKLVSKGDFVINSMNYGIGSYGLSALDGICSPVYIVLRPRLDRIESRYAFRIFENHAFQTFAQSFGNGILEHRAAINWDILKSIGVGIPPKEEQIAILNFLDRETGKIDALIAEQQRLVELLAEKRQAVISHAVTKGLNPNAPMTDSGIEWLGEVPEHWVVKRLKTISPFISVGIVVNPSEYVADDGLPFIYGGDISEGKINFQTSRRITDHDSRRNEKTRLSAGDLLTVRVGAPGITAVVPPECEGGNCASVMYVQKGNFSSYWLCYAMNDKSVRYQVEVVQYGAAQEQFNISHAINFWIATPPREEQNDIAAYLDAETAKFDTLTAEANRAIDLLQERRSALISAAVTGKIDVRGDAAC